MPLFSSSKFSPKKTPQRKTCQNFSKIKANAQDEELKLDVETIKLNIGDQMTVFTDGEWISGIYFHSQLLERGLLQSDSYNYFKRFSSAGK